MMILPRQARDKHRESTKKERRFLYRISSQTGTQHWSGAEKTPFVVSNGRFLLMKHDRLPRQALDKHNGET